MPKKKQSRTKYHRDYKRKQRADPNWVEPESQNQKQIQAKADAKRVAVINTIRVNADLAPDIERQIKRIMRREKCGKNAAILAAIEAYSETLK